ncbi:MAG: putative metal-binding motif-containing protein, partial [Deltaproteobacteria bacterium]
AVVGSPTICPGESGGAGTDCNDDDPTSYPGAIEVCDDDLEDCSGITDDGCNVDGDNYCTPAMAVVGSPTVCPDETGDSYPGTAGTDCNDNDITSYPGATEVCDDDLETCGGITDDGCNDDSDNYCDFAMNVVGSPAVCSAESGDAYPGTPGTDCDDSEATTHPGAIEICGDGISQDCDPSLICDGGTIDSDGDEYASIASGGTDCDDDDAATYPGAVEICGDGISQDCDASLICDGGTVDSDGDEYASIASGGSDCNDSDDTSYPGALEVCDGNLETCGGVADDGCNGDGDNYCDDSMNVVGSPAVCSAESGGAYPGTLGTDCDDSNINIYPGASELDNGIDDDCDGDAIELGLFDGDGDGYTDNYGSASDPTPDCDDTDTNNWTTFGCNFCEDIDGDGWYVYCDRYQTIQGPDCDDGAPLVFPIPPDDVISCPGSDSWSTTGMSNLNDYSCDDWNESGPEYIYELTTGATCDITANLCSQSVDLDVFILSDNPEGACPNNCVAYGNDWATYLSAPAGTYYIVVDGYDGAQGAYDLLTFCGDCPVGNCCYCDTTTIAYGGTYNGSLTATDDIWGGFSYFDDIEFEATTGDCVRIDLDGVFFDAYLLLCGPDQKCTTIYDENDDCTIFTSDSCLDVTIPNSGVWTIIATSWGALETGNYLLTIDEVICP